MGFYDAALLLVGHGSSLTSDSAAPVYQQAAALRRRGVFGSVTEAFWKQEPRISAALAQVQEKRIFVLPFLISEGYFADEVIPQELGLRQAGQPGFPRVQQRGEQTIYYCPPIGAHPHMSAIILARAREVMDKHPFPVAPRPDQTALFIAGHGTERHENSRQAVDRQAGQIAAQGHYAEVHTVFLEEEPRIGRCFELAKSRHLVMVPFFISDGPHSSQDIPILLGEPERVVKQRLAQGQPPWRNPTERHGKLLWYSRGVGTDPHLADVILEIAEEAAGTT